MAREWSATSHLHYCLKKPNNSSALNYTTRAFFLALRLFAAWMPAASGSPCGTSSSPGFSSARISIAHAPSHASSYTPSTLLMLRGADGIFAHLRFLSWIKTRIHTCAAKKKVA